MQLTHFPFTRRRLFSASFSPGGKQIVFAKADAKGRGDVWIIDADGTNPHPVLTVTPWDSAPDWGPRPGDSVRLRRRTGGDDELE